MLRLSARQHENRQMAKDAVQVLVGELGRAEERLAEGIQDTRWEGVSWAELSRLTGRDRYLLARDHSPPDRRPLLLHQ